MFASVLHWAISVPGSLGKDALSSHRCMLLMSEFTLDYSIINYVHVIKIDFKNIALVVTTPVFAPNTLSLLTVFICDRFNLLGIS